jgi:hypothetical protein
MVTAQTDLKDSMSHNQNCHNAMSLSYLQCILYPMSNDSIPHENSTKTRITAAEPMRSDRMLSQSEWKGPLD